MKSAFCWPYVSSDHPAAVGHHRCTWIEEDSGITGHCGHWTPLWRTLTSPQCHKSRQIPDSEPQPLRDAVERPDALLKRRPDLRLSADPGSRGRHPEDGHHDTFPPVRMREHAVWSAERRENIPTFYVRSDERVAILLRLLTRRAGNKPKQGRTRKTLHHPFLWRQDEAGKVRLLHTEKRVLQVASLQPLHEVVDK
ncbi:hypothetical protein T11_15405 [Trichinella zimbabwensis]|uniref:Uncharacterized protein n=1 Tax=Trichinella zimbabwensis TaxID=268475 RepID=A0A0V1HK71_9BILA|nr:hypothetical protein T11_15405 [Trichinella zimbabwensis]